MCWPQSTLAVREAVYNPQAKMCGTLCLLWQIPAIFAPSPLPPPPYAMLDDSSASLSLWTTLHGGKHGGKGGGVEFGPNDVCFHVKKRLMVEALHSARVSHIILARVVAWTAPHLLYAPSDCPRMDRVCTISSELRTLCATTPST